MRMVQGGARTVHRRRPAVLEPLLARGHSVFLDLKFHDIPNTVAGAVRSAAALGVRMVTFTPPAVPAMLAAARAALDGIADPPELLAVTVLTSMDAAQVSAMGSTTPPRSRWNCWRAWASTAGIRGFVCSPQEVATLRALTGPEGVLVRPRHPPGRCRHRRSEAHCDTRLRLYGMVPATSSSAAPSRRPNPPKPPKRS